MALEYMFTMSLTSFTITAWMSNLAKLDQQRELFQSQQGRLRLRLFGSWVSYTDPISGGKET
jgi:hypothetical protein